MLTQHHSPPSLTLNQFYNHNRNPSQKHQQIKDNTTNQVVADAPSKGKQDKTKQDNFIMKYIDLQEDQPIPQKQDTKLNIDVSVIKHIIVKINQIKVLKRMKSNLMKIMHKLQKEDATISDKEKSPLASKQLAKTQWSMLKIENKMGKIENKMGKIENKMGKIENKMGVVGQDKLQQQLTEEYVDTIMDEINWALKEQASPSHKPLMKQSKVDIDATLKDDIYYQSESQYQDQQSESYNRQQPSHPDNLHTQQNGQSIMQYTQDKPVSDEIRDDRIEAMHSMNQQDLIDLKLVKSSSMSQQVNQLPPRSKEEQRHKKSSILPPSIKHEIKQQVNKKQSKLKPEQPNTKPSLRSTIKMDKQSSIKHSHEDNLQELTNTPNSQTKQQYYYFYRQLYRELKQLYHPQFSYLVITKIITNMWLISKINLEEAEKIKQYKSKHKKANRQTIKEEIKYQNWKCFDRKHKSSVSVGQNVFTQMHLNSESSVSRALRLWSQLPNEVKLQWEYNALFVRQKCFELIGVDLGVRYNKQEIDGLILRYSQQSLKYYKQLKKLQTI